MGGGGDGRSLGWLRAAVCTLRHSNRAHRPVSHFFPNGIPPFGTEKQNIQWGFANNGPQCYAKINTARRPTHSPTPIQKAREPNMPRASFRSGGKIFNKITIDHDGSRAARATGPDRNTTQAAVHGVRPTIHRYKHKMGVTSCRPTNWPYLVCSIGDAKMGETSGGEVRRATAVYWHGRDLVAILVGLGHKYWIEMAGICRWRFYFFFRLKIVLNFII